jgi:hypothetical protein
MRHKAKGTGVTGAFAGVTFLWKRLLCLSPQTLVTTALTLFRVTRL